jgi:hypothetical protein
MCECSARFLQLLIINCSVAHINVLVASNLMQTDTNETDIYLNFGIGQTSDGSQHNLVVYSGI